MECDRKNHDSGSLWRATNPKIKNFPRCARIWILHTDLKTLKPRGYNPKRSEFLFTFNFSISQNLPPLKKHTINKSLWFAYYFSTKIQLLSETPTISFWENGLHLGRGTFAKNRESLWDSIFPNLGSFENYVCPHFFKNDQASCFLCLCHKKWIHRWRPYRVECTRSLLTSEVKRHRAQLVLGWGTAWEAFRVLPAFFFFILAKWKWLVLDTPQNQARIQAPPQCRICKPVVVRQVLWASTLHLIMSILPHLQTVATRGCITQNMISLN